MDVIKIYVKTIWDDADILWLWDVNFCINPFVQVAISCWKHISLLSFSSSWRGEKITLNCCKINFSKIKPYTCITQVYVMGRTFSEDLSMICHEEYGSIKTKTKVCLDVTHFYQQYLLILRWCHKNMTNVSKTFHAMIKSFF